MFKDLFLLLNYVNEYVSVFVWPCVYRSQKKVSILRHSVTGSCKQPDVDAGKQA